jgi:mono/diheme cytochrome c family protein
MAVLVFVAFFAAYSGSGNQSQFKQQAPGIEGQQVGDPAAGKQLAERTCIECHGAQNTSRKAPAFSTIAAMPSTTTQSLDVFLRTSHPTMPNLILSGTDRGDLIAYILSLR